MEVSHKSRTQQEINNAVGGAGIGFALGAGLNAFRQKGSLGDSEKIKTLETDILQLEGKIKEKDEEKGISGVFSKFTNLFNKRDLTVKKDMLESLPKKEFSYKAMGKYAAFFALDMAVISLAVDKIIDTVKGRKD